MSASSKIVEATKEPVSQTINHAVEISGKTAIVGQVTIGAGEVTGVIEKGLTITEYAALISIPVTIIYGAKLLLDVIFMVIDRIDKRRNR